MPDARGFSAVNICLPDLFLLDEKERLLLWVNEEGKGREFPLLLSFVVIDVTASAHSLPV